MRRPNHSTSRRSFSKHVLSLPDKEEMVGSLMSGKPDFDRVFTSTGSLTWRQGQGSLLFQSLAHLAWQVAQGSSQEEICVPPPLEAEIKYLGNASEVDGAADKCLREGGAWWSTRTVAYLHPSVEEFVTTDWIPDSIGQK